jgi:hypothetical protein
MGFRWRGDDHTSDAGVIQDPLKGFNAFDARIFTAIALEKIEPRITDGAERTKARERSHVMLAPGASPDNGDVGVHGEQPSKEPHSKLRSRDGLALVDPRAFDSSGSAR